MRMGGVGAAATGQPSPFRQLRKAGPPLLSSKAVKLPRPVGRRRAQAGVDEPGRLFRMFYLSGLISRLTREGAVWQRSGEEGLKKFSVLLS